MFFIAKSDGTVDIWDILDRTHAPILTQSIGVHKLTYLNYRIHSRKNIKKKGHLKRTKTILFVFIF